MQSVQATDRQVPAHRRKKGSQGNAVQARQESKASSASAPGGLAIARRMPLEATEQGAEAAKAGSGTQPGRSARPCGTEKLLLLLLLLLLIVVVAIVIVITTTIITTIIIRTVVTQGAGLARWRDLLQAAG